MYSENKQFALGTCNYVSIFCLLCLVQRRWFNIFLLYTTSNVEDLEAMFFLTML